MSEQDTASRKRYPLAIALWVVVAGALAYGISQTVIKASALF
jgi:hypothetical protein